MGRCRVVVGTVPTLLHPTAHQEPPLQLSIFDEVFRLPDELAYLTPEEAALVGDRFPGVSGSVVGVGVDELAPADVTAFRRRYGRSRPYLRRVGRVDDAKGGPSFCSTSRPTRLATPTTSNSSSSVRR